MPHVLTLSDNTNADPETRAVWVTLAQKLNVPIRCVLFTASSKLCEHNDTFRALNLSPDVSLNIYTSRRYFSKLFPVEILRFYCYTNPMRKLRAAEHSHYHTEKLPC
jgi:hypothetical protein